MRAELDLSNGQLFLDGLETIDLNEVSIPNTYRLEEKEAEQAPAEGVYQSRNVEWHLPFGPTIYPAGTPKIGDIVTDNDDQTYVVLEVRPPFLSDFWGIQTRGLVISEAFDLNDTISLFSVVIKVDEFGSRKASHDDDPDSDFVNVPCKIQIRPVEIVIARGGKQQFQRNFDIYCERDIDVHIGDILKDQNMNKYDIVSWKNRERIDEMSHIVANYTD